MFYITFRKFLNNNLQLLVLQRVMPTGRSLHSILDSKWNENVLVFM